MIMFAVGHMFEYCRDRLRAALAEWLGTGLPSRLQEFDPPRPLQRRQKNRPLMFVNEHGGKLRQTFALNRRYYTSLTVGTYQELTQ